MFLPCLFLFVLLVFERGNFKMKKCISFIAAIICLLTFLNPAAASLRAPTVILDTNSLGGYSGDYVLIYNPSTLAVSSMTTGSMSGLIQTSALQGSPCTADSADGMSIIDIDSEVKTHSGTFSEPADAERLGECGGDYTVGSIKSFFVDPYYSPNGEGAMLFECLAVGEHCRVWSLPSGYDNGWALQDIDVSLADELTSEFDAKYPLLHENFGSDDYADWYAGDGRLNILCYNIEEGWVPGNTSSVGGYFSSETCLYSHEPMIHLDTYPTISRGSGETSLNTARRVLMHEYTHLITYAQTCGTEDWLEEVMASAAEEVCYPGSCITARIPFWDASLEGYSMFNWSGEIPQVGALYARGALFGQYLYSRFGNAVFGEIIRLIAQGSTPVAAVYTATGSTLANLLMQFYLALIINDTEVEGGIYGFALPEGYDPVEYGIQNPYSLLAPQVYTGSSCTLYGGSAIAVRPNFGAYYPPSSAANGLKYVGVKIIRPTCTVTFIGFDGAVLSAQTVYEGSAAAAPEVPLIEGYTFARWSCGFDCIAADTVVTALYAENSKLITGDANCNGGMEFADVAFTCSFILSNITPDNAFYINADLNRDGHIDLVDVTMLYTWLFCGSY